MTLQVNSPVPPDHSQVVGRTLCLSTLLVRGTLETAQALAADPEDRAAYHELTDRLGYWLGQEDFAAQFTATENDWLALPPGGWDGTQQEAQGELIEGLGVLLWALGLYERFPACDEPFPMHDLDPLVGWPAHALVSPHVAELAQFPARRADVLLSITQLRPLPELRAQRGTVECWLWRSQMAAVQRSQPHPAPGQDYGVTIGIAAEEAHAAGAIGRPVQNDFPIKGRPFGRLPEAVQLECARLAAARKPALDWLRGYATAWDEAPAAVAA